MGGSSFPPKFRWLKRSKDLKPAVRYSKVSYEKKKNGKTNSISFRNPA